MASGTNSKPRTIKRKITDITKSEKPPVVSAPQLIIQHRPLIETDTTPAKVATPDIQPLTPTTAPTLPPTRRTAIIPISADESTNESSAEPTPLNEAGIPASSAPPSAAEPEAVEPSAINPDDTPVKPLEKQAIKDTSIPPKRERPIVPGAGAPEPATDTIGSAESSADTSAAAKLSAETRKAVAEAEAAAKHEQELEAYIDKRHFFVPINSVARKRSIQVSGGLTFVVFLLGIVLINLMLDAGLILLLEKIPHTHFFST